MFVFLWSFFYNQVYDWKGQSWNSAAHTLAFLTGEIRWPHFNTQVYYTWINAAVVFIFIFILPLLSFFIETTLHECEGNTKTEEYIFRWITICIAVYLVVLPRSSDQALDLGQLIWVEQFNSPFTSTQEYEGIPNLMSSCCNFKWLDEQLMLMKSRFQAMSLQRSTNFVLFTRT